MCKKTEDAQIDSCGDVFVVPFNICDGKLPVGFKMSSILVSRVCKQGPCGELHFRPTASNRSCQRPAAVSF